MAKQSGRSCKAYYSTTPLSAADFFTAVSPQEMTNTSDVTVNSSREQIDADTRGNSGFKSYLSGLKDATATTTVAYDPSDSTYTAISTAYENGTEIAAAFMSGDITTLGPKGLAGNWLVTQFEEQQPLNGVHQFSVTFSASSYTHRYTVTST